MGSAVCCPEPLEITNEGALELITVMFTGPVACPWATLSVPPAEGELNKKVCVVAVTARFTLAMADAAPETPFTVTGVVDAAMLAVVVIVNCVVICVVVLVTSTLVGLKVQVAPVGNPLQLKLTVPTNGVPLGAKGATVIVLVVLLPAATLTGLSAPAVTVNSAIAAAHACANAFALGEPSPVTWS